MCLYEAPARHRIGSYESPLVHRGGHPQGHPGGQARPLRLGGQHHQHLSLPPGGQGLCLRPPGGQKQPVHPLVAQEDYQAFDSRAVLERLYGSPRNFVAALAREGMRRGELEELQALLDQLNGGRP